MKRSYAVVFERLPSNYGAYCPDVLGCVATADGWAEVQQMMREALEFHFEGMQENGDPIPKPSMGIAEAMRYHSEQAGDEPVGEWEFTPPVEVTVAMVEVEINVGATAEAAEAAGVGD